MKKYSGCNLKAATSMAKVHGHDHERTLFAKEHLCRVAVLLGGQHLDSTRDMMQHVLETRRTRLGREYPYTLLVTVNMAIVLAALGHHAEAIELIRPGLPIAERTMGPKHIGTLSGRQTLACVLGYCGQHVLTEEILVEVAANQKEIAAHKGDYHPDRLATLVELARCSFLMGKIERAVELCDEAIFGFDCISRVPHPIAVGLRTTRDSLAGRREAQVGDYQAQDDVEQEEIVFPFITYRP